MRFLIFYLSFIGLVGCDQLLHGQEQPVKLLKTNTYFTGCGGAVETWASCNNKAMNTCPAGYVVIRKDENSTGTVRELTFQCNK